MSFFNLREADVKRTLAILLSCFSLSTFAAGNTFSLKSAEFQHTKTIPQTYSFNGFGCTGENLSPSLQWENPPAGTKSFALMVHDPDAPTGGGGWWHWAVVNLPADVRSLPVGAGKANDETLPVGAVQLNSDYGSKGWGGPCPPVGDKPHRYHFTLYALKVEKLDLPEGATPALAGYMINANSLGKAILTGRFGR